MVKKDLQIGSRIEALLSYIRLHRRQVIIGSSVLVGAASLFWLWCYLRPDTWHYYTDQISFRQLAKDVEPSYVLWENAKPTEGSIAVPMGEAEPVVSPDGATMVFTRSVSAGHHDLFISRWDGKQWGEPSASRALNSKFNEIGPAFSTDSKFLFFSTDRPGGLGGYDIWVSRWDGADFAWPMPLTLMVNSRFDELGPAPSATDNRLYFSSNRPNRPLSKKESSFSNRKLLSVFHNVDHDIFAADRIPAGVTNREVERATSMLYSLREAALTDMDVMVKLGGTVKSERAVKRALKWLAQDQEADGRWSITKHGGQRGHDMAATAFALLTFYGRDERHDRRCEYRETVARGLKWLISEQNVLNGDTRGSGGNLYDHGIGTLALAEAYGLTKDQELYGPVQNAIDYMVDVQDEKTGGWRYNPGQPGDMSVSGWMIMAMKSAEMSGVHVPESAYAGVRKWLVSVSHGRHGGTYGYQEKGGNPRAMIVAGYFCSQLMGLSPNTLKSFETSDRMKKESVIPEDAYYMYYGTLAAYQSQGPLWRDWIQKTHKGFLNSQAKDGSWTVSGHHAKEMGKGICTSLIALSLQAHYRYTPLYGLGYEPSKDRARLSDASLTDLPQVPLYRRAKRYTSLNSPKDDMHVSVTEHGDFLYFASDRNGGYGGFDIYRSRISGDEPLIPENLGIAINSKQDDTGPTLRMAGFNLIFTSNRGQKDKDHHRLFSSVSRNVFARYDRSYHPGFGWTCKRYTKRLIALGLCLIVLIWLISHAARNRHVPKRVPGPRMCRIIAGVTTVLMIGLLSSTFLALRRTAWCYYTDDVSIKRGAHEANVRLVLWADPYSVPAQFNVPTNSAKPVFSADGTSLTLTRQQPDSTKAVTSFASWNGRTWSSSKKVRPSVADTNEMPRTVRDGSYVYFDSDMKGGLGGRDIYRNRVLNSKPLLPENLETVINSRKDELSPATRMEGFDMVFSSNRDRKNADEYLLYSSTVREVVGGLDLSRWYSLVSLLSRIKWWVVAFAAAIAMLVYLLRHWKDLTDLFHKCLAGSIAIHAVLLLILSVWFISLELLESVEAQTMEVAIDVNALAKEKLALDMQNDIAEMPQSDVSVLVEQTKEPVPMPEFTPQPDKSGPPIVAKSVDKSFVSKASPSKAVEEELELDAPKQFKPLPDIEMPTPDVVMDVPKPEAADKSAIARTEFEPVTVQEEIIVERKETETVATTPIAEQAKASDVALTNTVHTSSKTLDAGPDMVVASAAMESPGFLPALAGAAEVAQFKSLSDIEMPTPDVVMDVPKPEAVKKSAVARMEFEPVTVHEEITVERKKTETVATTPVAKQAKPSDVALMELTKASDAVSRILDTGGDIVVASAGMESPGFLPELEGAGEVVGLIIKSPGSDRGLKIDAPGQLDVPASSGDSISPVRLKHPGKLSTEVIESLGGSARTQGSIARALDWFSKNQEPDGRWDIRKHGGQSGHDTATTSLILLCYYGWGAKHNEAGPYQKNVKKGIGWLLKEMKKDKDGNFTGDLCTDHGSNGMYDQGMATIALCEAYGLTKDKTILEPAQKAVTFIVRAQNKQIGGWRYRPQQSSDTSVFGWQYMALKSAQLAGLEVPEETFRLAEKWLDHVGGGKHGGVYGYTRPGGNQGAMIGTGMFCRQLAKIEPRDPRMMEGAQFMSAHPLKAENIDFYYLYYATLALYQHQGKIWTDWNTRMKEILTSAQIKTGSNAGTWDPQGGHGAPMGRLVTTALGTLSLEVYYRILPIYGFRSSEEE